MPNRSHCTISMSAPVCAILGLRPHLMAGLAANAHRLRADDAQFLERRQAAHRVAGELIAVAALGRTAGRRRDHQMRLLGRLQRVLGAVGELRRHARHHADEPHARRVSPTLNGTIVKLLVVRHMRPRGEARQRRADDRIGVGRRRLGRHLQRHQRGQIVDRRDQQPFADASGRRCPGARSPGWRCRSPSGSDSRFSTVMPCFFRASLVMVFSISAKALPGKATSRTKTPFCSVLEAGKGRGGLETRAAGRTRAANRSGKRRRRRWRAAAPKTKQDRATAPAISNLKT